MNKREARLARKAQTSADATGNGGQFPTEDSMNNTEHVASSVAPLASEVVETQEAQIARLTAELASHAPVAVAPVAPVSFDRQPNESLEVWAARLAVASKSAQSAVAVERLQSGQLGANIACKLNGSILTLTVDLSKRLGRTGSDKSDSIATTGGNQPIGYEGIMAGINFFAPDRKLGKSRR